jgi:hypothetical protein
MSPPCFLAVERTERMMAKSFAPSWDRNPPEIFWPILLDQVIGEGHAGIGQEAQHVLFADAEAQQKVMACPSRRTATAPGFCQCRLYFVERQTFRQDGVVAALDQRDQTGVQRHARSRARLIAWQARRSRR